MASPQSVQQLDVLPLGGLVHRGPGGARVSHLAARFGGASHRPIDALDVSILRDDADPVLARPATETTDKYAREHPAEPRLTISASLVRRGYVRLAGHRDFKRALSGSANLR